MIIYNVTIKVDTSISPGWFSWMKEEHIPDVIGTGCFTEYKMFRLLEVDDSEGATYVVQYFAESLEKYKGYIDQYANTLRKKLIDKWGDRVIAFRTLMELV
jgi:hypothetical protein